MHSLFADQALGYVHLTNSEVLPAIGTLVSPADHPAVVKALDEQEVRALLDSALLHVLADYATLPGSLASMYAYFASEASCNVDLPSIRVDIMLLVKVILICLFVRNFLSNQLLHSHLVEDFSVEPSEACLALYISLRSFAYSTAFC